METALDGWRRWNAAWETPLFHEVGVTFLGRTPMEPGGFEHESFVDLSVPSSSYSPQALAWGPSWMRAGNRFNGF